MFLKRFKHQKKELPDWDQQVQENAGLGRNLPPSHSPSFPWSWVNTNPTGTSVTEGQEGDSSSVGAWRPVHTYQALEMEAAQPDRVWQRHPPPTPVSIVPSHRACTNEPFELHTDRSKGIWGQQQVVPALCVERRLLCE